MYRYTDKEKKGKRPTFLSRLAAAVRGQALEVEEALAPLLQRHALTPLVI